MLLFEITQTFWSINNIDFINYRYCELFFMTYFLMNNNIIFFYLVSYK